jgi:natural product biosynthesis luciferase-like monooxygenase protein
MVGLFINTLPVRLRVPPEARLAPWLQQLRAQQRAGREFQYTPLVNLHKWSGLPAGTPLFDSIVVFDRAWLQAELHALGEPWTRREFPAPVERTNYPLTLFAYGEPELWLRVTYDRDRLGDPAASRLLGHLNTLLAGMVDDPLRALASMPMVTDEERRTLLIEWNDTATAYPRADCVHQQFEAQARRTPDAVALVCGEEHVTYRELDARTNRLARYLQKLGVGPDVLVGICTRRSVDMVVAILGVHKAGGAYVPLDPSYPPERLRFMLEDAHVAVLLTQDALRGRLLPHSARELCLDADWETIASDALTLPASAVRPEHLAYVIYTSGSTGTPKGVMVEHRNVVSFFTAMDARLGSKSPGTWLAVTSLSFDISVLELLWTLTRGWKVVIHVDPSSEGAAAVHSPRENRSLDFSLFYFASAGGQQRKDQYRLLLDGARFADRHRFAAVWTPERHFHPFGGLYPNPSVSGAAIAAITERIQIRAGSVVLPLHHPVRVTEEWAVVDNLSNGRVGISFASGWQPDDFALAPGNYAERKELMYRHIETVRKLWRGETLSFPGAKGAPVAVRTLPRPVQPELPVWVTSAGSTETYEAAGGIGANLLTHLLGQTFEELGDRIAAYRRSWEQHGHGPGRGHVTLMLHTFVGEDDDSVRDIVRQPMIEYLRSSVSLIKSFAAVWAARRGKGGEAAPVSGDEFQNLSPEDMEALLVFAFERYFETSGLFGGTETCLRMLEGLKAIDVDEVACLIDFGVDPQVVLAHLPHLDRLKQRVNAAARDASTIPDLIRQHRVTHLQCTPSKARLLLAETSARDALRNLRTLLVGGEALTPDLVADLQEATSADILNMYGPTETTVWSATHRVDSASGAPPIGRPISNTELYILDRHLQPLPVGVAGELFIGGAGVARGYLRRPELTAERFAPHPFRHESTGRLYRTGDLARYRADGTVEFLGRIDHQVKIRGHRIELGEIEHALANHPAVREAVVVAREETPGDVRLIAFLGVNGGPTPTSSTLRDFLARSLPAAMVPGSFVVLDALPRTANGKLDRHALPSPDRVHSDRTERTTAPRTPIEATLAEIWKRVLRVEHVGIDDSFTDLAGNSLSSIQVAFGIRSAFQIELPLEDILTAPTLRALAERVEERLREEAGEAKLAALLRGVADVVPGPTLPEEAMRAAH